MSDPPPICAWLVQLILVNFCSADSDTRVQDLAPSTMAMGWGKWPWGASPAGTAVGFRVFSLESFIPMRDTARIKTSSVCSSLLFPAGRTMPADMGWCWGFIGTQTPSQGIHTAEGHNQHPPPLYSRIKKKKGGGKERQSSSILILLP